ncbi:MAG: hypothetical protein L6Q95_11515 [Planctomycetes bacterium]|nr:hypothetical protein [Planctomycetota bacterium]
MTHGRRAARREAPPDNPAPGADMGPPAPPPPAFLLATVAVLAAVP